MILAIHSQSSDPGFLPLTTPDICCGPFRFPRAWKRVADFDHDRPETVESLFMAFRLTGDKRYRQYGWKIFKAIERHCKVETGGYVTILDVDDVKSPREDKMETFFLVIVYLNSRGSLLNSRQSETLKYLYLLFDDTETLPLDSESTLC